MLTVGQALFYTRSWDTWVNRAEIPALLEPTFQWRGDNKYEM